MVKAKAEGTLTIADLEFQVTRCEVVAFVNDRGALAWGVEIDAPESHSEGQLGAGRHVRRRVHDGRRLRVVADARAGEGPRRRPAPP